jgi:hypothetical protein
MPSNYTKRVGFYVNLGASIVKPKILLVALLEWPFYFFYGFKSCMYKNKAYNIGVKNIHKLYMRFVEIHHQEKICGKSKNSIWDFLFFGLQMPIIMFIHCFVLRPKQIYDTHKF